MQRLAIAIALATVVVTGTALAQAPPVRAGSGGGSGVTCDPLTYTCTVTVTTPGSPGGSSGGSGGSSSSEPWACAWQAITTQQAQTYENSVFPPPLIHDGAAGPNDNWYLAYCQQVNTSNYAIYVVEVNGTLPIATPAQVGQMAVSDLTFPQLQIATSPPTSGTCGECAVVINLPTYLALPSSDWQTLTATATVGGVTATATAAPQSIEWDPGDGHTVTCAPPQAPGVGYSAATGNGSPPPDACTYTYAYPDQTGSYSLSATVSYHITWTSNAGAGGDLGLIAGPPATVTIQLDQIRSIVTG